MPRKRPAPSKSRSGPSVPEDERLSVAIKLRLPPDVAARLIPAAEATAEITH